MRVPVLRQQIRARREVGLSDRLFLLALGNRFTYPLAGVPAALLAVALALRPGRGASLTGALVEGLAVTMGLWGLTVIARALVNAGRMAPLVAAALPLLVLTVALAALLWVPPGTGRRVLRSGRVVRSGGREPGRVWRRCCSRRGPPRSGSPRGCSRRWRTRARRLGGAGAAGARRCPGEARVPARAALGLAGWQAISPLVARALGAPGLPPAALWLHCLDTAALAAAALLGAQVVRWTWPEALFVAGGLLSLGLSTVQHLVRWSIPIPAFLRVPVDRVHETFGGEDRYAAGGFFFHRLRLAHAAVAALGPALATALRPAAGRRRVLAAALAVACVCCTVLAYARAALLTALLLALVAGVAVARSARVRAWSWRYCWPSAAAAVVSPGWHARLAAATENFVGGERALARAAGWDLVSRHPWLGVGFGNYRTAALARQGVTGITDMLSRDAHSIALTVWAETGLPGLVLWVVLHGTLAAGAAPAWRRAGNTVALGAALSWLGYQTLGIAHYLPFHPSVALGFALVWGVGLVHPAQSPSGRAVDREGLPGAALPGEGAGALAAGGGPAGAQERARRPARRSRRSTPPERQGRAARRRPRSPPGSDAGVGGEHRRAGGHRLERGSPKPSCREGGGAPRRCRRAPGRCDLVHLGEDAGRPGEHAPRAFAGEQHQRHREPGGDACEEREVLVRLGVAHRQEIARREVEARPDLEALLRRGWPEAGVDARRDDGSSGTAGRRGGSRAHPGRTRRP